MHEERECGDLKNTPCLVCWWMNHHTGGRRCECSPPPFFFLYVTDTHKDGQNVSVYKLVLVFSVVLLLAATDSTRFLFFCLFAVLL